MDVTLSIVAGLGLRIFLFKASDAGPSGKLTTALLGLWEGVVVHQLIGRSSSPQLDHVLAYGLRLAVDLLISKNIQRMAMVVLWSALGTVVCEAIVPYADLRAALKKEERGRERERRHRHSRSAQLVVPIVSTPLPPRVRAYKPPEQITAPITIATTPPLLPPQPAMQTSTPIFPTDRPPSPPSFFLQEQEYSDIYSPESPPKPIQIHLVQPTDAPPQDALPVRPRSGLATIFDRSPDSGSPLPIPMPLPTPPDSAQSAVPSDGPMDLQNNAPFEDPLKARFDNQLYTIPELSSPEDHSTPGALRHPMREVVESTVHQEQPTLSPVTANAPLPVPNAGLRRIPSGSVSRWLASSSNPNPEAIFTTPFSPSASPTASPTAALPVRLHVPDPFWEMRTPVGEDDFDEAAREGSFLMGEGEAIGNGVGDVAYPDDSDSDELRTPGALQVLQMETDNEYDPDPLQTPQQLRPPEDDDVLSPLALDMRSGLDEDSDRNPNLDSAGLESQPEPVTSPEDNMPVPGSLSRNMLLQTPLPPSGPLFRRPTPPPESPPPPSPSTIHSGVSDISILSTRIPNKLYSRADSLRQQARDEERVRAQLENDRRRAEIEGRSMDALLLKIKVRDKDHETHKLHEKAARRYYAARNTVDISNKIDVHGLRPREAFDRIERAIVKASNEGKTIVRVIVGKGLHSVNQQPTLKPAVQREMQRLNIPCEVDSRNPGILNISLPSSSRA